MNNMDRRQFIKTLSVVIGATAVTGTVPVLAEERPKKTKIPGPKKVYKVFALNYAGPFESKLARALYQTGWDDNFSICHYIWAIRSDDGETTLVDTGTGHALAKTLKYKHFVPPEQLVATLGVKSEQVTKVIITHMHFDHVGGMENFAQLYPNAVFYVQKSEFDFWVNDPISRRPPFKRSRYDMGNKWLSDLMGSPRLVMLDGDRVIGPDMELLLIPGHSPGLQGVLVNTAKGAAVVASDSAHIARSFRDDMPSSIVADMVTWLKSYDKLRARAPIENLFPGHDVLMLANYPKVADGISQLA